MRKPARWAASATVGVLLFLIFGAASCRQEPKGRDIAAVAKACGKDVADRYASIDWVDREYASDNLLITCILFPEEIRTKDKVEKDQTGG